MLGHPDYDVEGHLVRGAVRSVLNTDDAQQGHARVVSSVGSFLPVAAVDSVLGAHPTRRAIDR
jgi:hypothetical protein